MTGIEPPLIESIIFWINSISIAPLNNLFLNVFGFTFLLTLFLKIFDCSTNSLLNFSFDIFSKFCKSSSFSTGRTITKQSFSGKYDFIRFLTLFFSSTISDVPLTFSKEFSKYCFSVMTFPFLSSNFNEKSLKSHNKLGKYSLNSSSLSS